MFSPDELAAMLAADVEIEQTPVRLTPLERLAAAQLDREARWEAMDHRAAHRSKRQFQYRQEHAAEISANRRTYYQEHKEAENAQSHRWYLAHRDDAEWMELKREQNRLLWAENREEYCRKKRERYDPAKNSEQCRKYREAHRDELNAKKRAAYWAKKAEIQKQEESVCAVQQRIELTA